MPVGTWMTFVTALLIALAVPGPDLVLVVQSAAHSAGRGLITAAGIVAGLCLHAGLAVLGLAALLAAYPSALTAVRLVGAAVLLWLGVSMLRARRADAPAHEEVVLDSRGFLRGFVTNATNPKAMLFFAGILPQFTGTGSGTALRTAVLGATVVLGAMLWWAGTVLLVRVLRIGASPGSGRVVTLVGGVALVGIAVLLAAQTMGSPSGGIG